ncbi:ATP-dependent DNA helicase RecG [Yimella sp. cx-51]|uniref:ATP-dependent DNA helicase RecG n=1 Tax=Yimella sp. cx-51 TaxID=2770551 RepID=UPI00165E9DD3|nr:ATP-dependent DNA helicase RecG [Yimella sp. cx-51]MBC9956729.1 ATP-dependent DNA helicase RecG [Yimella sp. cx-51]QTH38966.1 ATP-dependent DNA helicase RecG [Yimella sp. cx-51]
MKVERSTPLEKVVNKTFAGKLAKNRDVHTVGDFLDFIPRRYLDANASGRLAEFEVGQMAVLVATVVRADTRPMRNRRTMMLHATIEDADGRHAQLVFFNARGHEYNLRPGATALFRGKMQVYNHQLQLAHPEYTAVADESALAAYASGLIPTYATLPRTSDLSITKAMQQVLGSWEGTDPVPEQLRERHRLLSLEQAYRMVHLPTSRADIGRGKRRLRYDEALVVQTALAARRAEYDKLEATPRVPSKGGLLERFDQRLPFELTAGQQAVGEQIAADLAAPRPMHRLLQGEVGSGKTIVALRAMLATIDSGAQAALLAPTEVLAQQHDRSMRAMLGDLAERGLLGGHELGTRVALLTGSMSKKAKEKVLLDIVSGEVGIVIGTHALIQDTVNFFDLGLVVVDEQHRFGVEQRDALRGKASRPPHVLVMTATPIPRTVAMTVFGDMDTSELTQLPSGRAPIVSHVVPASKPGWIERAWQRVAEEVAAGHQAYVVCPRIGDQDEPEAPLDGDYDLESFGSLDESDQPSQERPAKPELSSVVATLDRLRAEPALAGLRIEMLHGRMTPEEKDAVMGEFSAGQVDVLVSTTVIEVGVDVPNATAMVILDADRFGISQLHQLRGRVGRGSGGGLCLLVTATDKPETMERLSAVAATNNGFELADLDLSLRSEGDILGASQSGKRTGLKHLRLSHPKDVELIQLARADAAELIAADPTLSTHPALAELMTQRLDEDQVAFLERG